MPVIIYDLIFIVFFSQWFSIKIIIFKVVSQPCCGPVGWAAEYTDCISAEGLDSLNEFPGYHT